MVFTIGGSAAAVPPARKRAQARTTAALAKHAPAGQDGPVSRREEALVEELKELAGRLGMEVREETLLREVGWRVRSGACRVRGAEVVFVDRGLPPGERLEVLLDALATRDAGALEQIYVSPDVRRLLEQRSRPAEH
jgi:hypothetical protein